MIDLVNGLINKTNVALGGLVALMAYIFGDHWVLFGAFFLLNLADYISGYIKARLNGKESSKKGVNGALKKIGYWIMILVAFGMSVIFQEVGSVLNLDLGVTSLIGWFVLATLIINEVRSILENLVEAGINVPHSIIKGLEVANKAIDGKISVIDGSVELHLPRDDLTAKKTITLEVTDENSQ